MNLDVELQTIVRENEGDLLAFARKLYEYGYRQGLASRPTETAAIPESAVSRAAPPAPAVGPLFPSKARAAGSETEIDETETDDVDTLEEEEPATCDHRVRSSISVEGLQKKIERTFDLSRFDIEVVICRRGDPERRRLKSSAKLKNYLLEEE